MKAARRPTPQEDLFDLLPKSIDLPKDFSYNYDHPDSNITDRVDCFIRYDREIKLDTVMSTGAYYTRKSDDLTVFVPCYLIKYDVSKNKENIEEALRHYLEIAMSCDGSKSHNISYYGIEVFSPMIALSDRAPHNNEVLNYLYKTEGYCDPDDEDDE